MTKIPLTLLQTALDKIKKLKSKIRTIRADLKNKNKQLRLDNIALRNKVERAQIHSNTLDTKYRILEYKSSQDAINLQRYRESTIHKRRARVNELMADTPTKESVAYSIVNNEIPLW